MLRLLDRIFAFPMWVSTRVLVAMNPKHPWHERRFSLEDWRLHRTSLTKLVDMVIWVTLLCTALLLYRLHTLPR